MLVLVCYRKIENGWWRWLAGVFLISPRKIFYSASGVSSLIVRLGGTLDRFGPYTTATPVFQQTIYLARHQYLISLFIIFLLVEIELYSSLSFTGTVDVNFVLLVPSGILGQSFMDSSLSIWQNIQRFSS